MGRLGGLELSTPATELARSLKVLLVVKGLSRKKMKREEQKSDKKRACLDKHETRGSVSPLFGIQQDLSPYGWGVVFDATGMKHTLLEVRLLPGPHMVTICLALS